MFWLGLDSFGAGGALAALTLYLFLPYGVYASRAFQPDPLMTAGMIWALWALLRWQRKPGWGRALAAGALTGLAIYIKLTVIFFLAGAWIAVLLASIGLRAALRSRQGGGNRALRSAAVSGLSPLRDSWPGAATGAVQPALLPGHG